MAMNAKEVFEKAEDLKKQILADPINADIDKLLETIPEEDRKSVIAAFEALNPPKYFVADDPSLGDTSDAFATMAEVLGDKEPMQLSTEDRHTAEQIMENAGYTSQNNVFSEALDRKMKTGLEVLKEMEENRKKPNNALEVDGNTPKAKTVGTPLPPKCWGPDR